MSEPCAIFCQSFNHPRRNESFHKFSSITTQSIAQYANTLYRLLFSVFWSIDNSWNPSVHYPTLTPLQRDKFVNLLNALQDGQEDEVIDAAFHKACYALFAHERQPDWATNINKKFFSPINSFVVYASVGTDGSFDQASRMTQTLAMLMYAIRATMLIQSVRISDDNVISIFECVPSHFESLSIRL